MLEFWLPENPGTYLSLVTCHSSLITGFSWFAWRFAWRFARPLAGLFAGLFAARTVASLFRSRNSRDGVLEDELFLMVRLEDDGVFVETAKPAHQLDAAHQEDGDRQLIPPNGVEIDILDILRLAFHRELPQKDRVNFETRPRAQGPSARSKHVVKTDGLFF